MQIQVFTIGEASLPYVKLGVKQYLTRIQHYQAVTLESLRVRPPSQESQALLDASEQGYRVALDERGRLLSTKEVAQLLRQWRVGGERRVAFLIGGAEGHSEELRSQSNLVLALSLLTLQHELALLVLMEQLYRVCTLEAGHPYHRD